MRCRIYVDGVQLGFTYYRNKGGQDYIRDPKTDKLHPASYATQLMTEDDRGQCAFVPESERNDPSLNDDYCVAMFEEQPIELKELPEMTPQAQSVVCTRSDEQDRETLGYTDGE